MRRIFLTAMTLAASLAVAGAAWAGPDGAGGAAGGANPPATPPTKDAEAATFLKELPPLMAKQSDEDARKAIARLQEIWKDKEVTDATKKPVPEILEKYGKDGKSMVASIAIEALGGLGPAGGPPLMDLLDRALKAKEPSAETYGNCLRAIKKAADPRPATVKGLLELLKYKLDDVVAKAADAISGYKDAPGKVRREMLEEVIKQSEGVFSSSKDAKNGSAVTKWRIIQGSVLSALNALSGQQFADPSAARAWFNDHKKDKQWD